jgi:hypothetical protein
MADAWTRVTGEPAVALVTGGPDSRTRCLPCRRSMRMRARLF